MPDPDAALHGHSETGKRRPISWDFEVSRLAYRLRQIAGLSQSDPDEPDGRTRIIRWTCQSCGWTSDVPMPGFAGSMLGGEHRHWEGDRGCGPLLGELLMASAHPGADATDVVGATRRAGY
jgi:hypothetical protein